MTAGLLNLPNLLTLSRLAAIPVLMLLLLAGFSGHDQVAAALFLVASATDTLDGRLARRYQLVTELGKFLDPLADKLFVLSVMLVLVQQGSLPAWVVAVIFARELIITILRSVSAAQGRVIAAAGLGKTKTATQVGGVALVILARPYPLLQWPAWVVIGAAVFFTVWSGLDYLWRFRHVFIGSDDALAAAHALRPAGGAPGSESAVDPLAREVADRLLGAGLKLATAESCTGGLVAKLVTDLPGSSAYFVGGVVSYSNELKRSLLGVPEDLLRAHGAVSSEVAQAMAEGARRRLGAEVAVSVTGIAGPQAEGSEKPVGLVYIWVAGPESSQGRRFHFDGDRWRIRAQAAEAALRLVLEEVPEKTETV